MGRHVEIRRDLSVVVHDDRTLAEARAERLQETREGAARWIAAFAPIHKQLNAITDRLAALEQAARIAPPPAAAELVAEISAVRDICNVAEASIAAAPTNDAADAVRPAWPATPVAIDAESIANLGAIDG